jgi:hypothetical protein
MLLIVALLGCKTDPPEPADADPVVAPHDSTTSADTGTSVITPTVCHLEEGSVETRSAEQHQLAVVHGVGHTDHLGYSVECSSVPSAVGATSWFVGAPEFDDLGFGPGGYVLGFDGQARGRVSPESSSLILIGESKLRDTLGLSLEVDSTSNWVWAGAGGSSRYFDFAGSIWGVDLASSRSEMGYGDVDAYIVGATARAGAYRGVPLGDLDGDGRSELVVGHSFPDIVSESSDGFLAMYAGADLRGDVWIDQAVAQFDDRGHVNVTGRSMWAVDVDGDGHVDLVHGENAGSELGAGDGRVAIMLGPLLERPVEGALTADIELRQPDGGGSFGVFGDMGDLDGDGVVDLVFSDTLVSDPDVGDRVGAAYVYFGPLTEGEVREAEEADLIVGGTRASGLFGSPIVGDHDGDGHDDLLLSQLNGDPGCGGTLWVFSGPLQSGRRTTDDADFVYVSGSPNTGFGLTMAMCDLDGDGAEEVVVGEPYFTDDEVVDGPYYYDAGGPVLHGRARVLTFHGSEGGR